MFSSSDLTSCLQSYLGDPEFAGCGPSTVSMTPGQAMCWEKPTQAPRESHQHTCLTAQLPGQAACPSFICECRHLPRRSEEKRPQTTDLKTKRLHGKEWGQVNQTDVNSKSGSLSIRQCNSRQKKKNCDQMSLYGSIFSVYKVCNLQLKQGSVSNPTRNYIRQTWIERYGKRSKLSYNGRWVTSF